MTELGSILSCGAHVPRLRLQRSAIAAAMSWLSPPGRGNARGTRAVGNWDEDALTMGVEAARGCLAAAPRANGDDPEARSSEEIESLLFCSTTAPFADRDDAVMLSSALDLPPSVDTLNVGASLRAGTRGLITALHGGNRALVVASDARLTRAGSSQELTYGDGAAAVLVGPPADPALATVLATVSLGSDFVDHYRMSGESFDYALEERWIRDESLLKIVPLAVADVLLAAGVAAADVRHFILPASHATSQRVALACQLSEARREQRVLLECGDAGAALPLLMLCGTLETAAAGDLVVMVGLGQGVDALLLRVGAGAAAFGRPLSDTLERKRDEPSYVRYLSHRGLLDVDFGMRSERDQRTAHTVAFRKAAALNAFKGGRCERCGTVQFPQARVCVNPECRATDTQVAHRLADSSGRIKSFTEDWQAYSARPPYSYGNVEFSEGGNLLMEFTDVEPGELKVNDAVRFVYRVKDDDRARGFRRYFWKASPA
jgi:3-hydroxy-3-methylglutaryl CoA synthase